MARALSLDLRERVIAAIEGGATCRKAAERFSVGVATAIRWHARFRAEGENVAKSMGGDRRTTEPLPEDRSTRVIDSVNLEDLLGEIETYGANGHGIGSGWGAPRATLRLAARSGGRPPHQPQITDAESTFSACGVIHHSQG